MKQPELDLPWTTPLIRRSSREFAYFQMAIYKFGEYTIMIMNCLVMTGTESEGFEHC